VYICASIIFRVLTYTIYHILHYCLNSQVLSADGTQPVGKISKQWGGLLKECFTSADNFKIQCERLSDCHVVQNFDRNFNKSLAIHQNFSVKLLCHMVLCAPWLIYFSSGRRSQEPSPMHRTPCGVILSCPVNYWSSNLF